MHVVAHCNDGSGSAVKDIGEKESDLGSGRPAELNDI